MKNSVLILSVYPAPYRMHLFESFILNYTVDIFFEKSEGDLRNSEWFIKGNFFTLDTDLGKQRYECAIKHIRDYSVVLIYDFTSIEAIKLILKCKLFSVPYVINCDGVILTPHGNFVNRLIKKILVKGAEACLASGDYAKQYFIEAGSSEEKIYMHPFTTLYTKDIRDAVPSKKEKELLRTELGLPINKKIALGVGRFIPLKRFDVLLTHWARLSDEYFLVLVGGGECKSIYDSLIKQYNLENVAIIDFCKYDILEKYYCACDIFVHPSQYECWGLVVNEALANGLPVVITDTCVAGLELIENDHNGTIVELGNDEGFMDMMKKYLDDTDLLNKMSTYAIETIRGYTIEEEARIHLSVINKIINNKICI